MRLNEIWKIFLNTRDYIITFLRFIFFILIMITFLGFWYVFSLDAGNFDDGKYSEGGVTYIFENYKNSIGVGTAFIAILAIYLTMRRMNQAQTQIQVMGANNQFNNFYKHREEFTKHLLKKSFITTLALAAGRSNEDLIINYHGFYFGTNFDSFDAKINNDRMKEIQKCFSSLEKFNMSPNNFEEFIIKEKPTLSYDWPLDHITETDKLITKRYEEHKQKFIKWEDSMGRLKAICNFYYDYKIKVQILTFSGEEHKVSLPTDFTKNFEEFLNKSGLYILIV